MCVRIKAKEWELMQSYSLYASQVRLKALVPDSPPVCKFSLADHL